MRALATLLGSAALAGLAPGCASPATEPPAAARPRNVIIILSDDHRHDFLGFLESAPPFLETPHLDRMARRGAHLRNAFVTTALCSPSRASILTGQYAHRHRVVDNTSPIPPGTVFFPQRLQSAGYRTALIGKWHMGEETDVPQPGFNRWVSFKGQGTYEDPQLNFDGRRQTVRGYTTDILTAEALRFLENHRASSPEKPYFLILSHKAVHAEFHPAPRHRGRYASARIPYPATMADSGENYRDKPRWVREQRGSWHGVDFMYHGAIEFDAFYRAYAEALLALDESVGRVLDWVDRSGQAGSTLVLYLGDNGFLLGEHGLIDKRNAYEESMRIPMLAYAPGLVAPGSEPAELVRNIDIAPTVLELAGVPRPAGMDGQSFAPLLRGQRQERAAELLYEYYWEHAFPHTPTVLALRDARFKYIFYQGVWDTDELYDLAADPREQRNLIATPEHAARAAAMKRRMWQLLEQTGGMNIPLKPAGSWQAAERRPPDEPAVTP
jgi:N-acetylglucosamine-6-sulfatase